MLFGAILLFLVSKALCSLVHCFNSHQEISPCSGSAMPLVPACVRPGGSGLVRFRADLASLGSEPPFLLMLPACLHRAGRESRKTGSR